MSSALLEAISRELAGGNQVLLFLNRRGYAPTLQCHDCGFVAGCPHCDARLTLHKRATKILGRTTLLGRITTYVVAGMVAAMGGVSWLAIEGPRTEILGVPTYAYANLTSSNLAGADLSEVNLRRADLRRADLRGSVFDWPIISPSMEFGPSLPVRFFVSRQLL